MFRILSLLLLVAFTTDANAQMLAPQPRPATLGQPPVPTPERRPADLAQRNPVDSFYRMRNYTPFWTAPDQAMRLELFTIAARDGWQQGLPVSRYNIPALLAASDAALPEAEKARLDVAITRAFLDFARDQRRGVLRPSRVDPTIVRDIQKFDPLAELAAFEAAPAAYMAEIVPDAPAYAVLMKTRIELSRAEWAPPVPMGQTVRPGTPETVTMTLARRLGSMGYDAGTGQSFDDALRGAVRAFQTDHGLQADGIAGAATLAEINVDRDTRLRAVLVALERWRWMNEPLGQRHIWVNLTEQVVRLVQDGRTTFTTRAVIGKPDPQYRTPEFSDRMEYMVVNPSWHVPRSITVAEYLPRLQRNPNAVPNLQIVDAAGNVMGRSAINFNGYDAKSFPYRMRQPPSDDNALGTVKFMFPNNWNIYLHDTPAKALFDQNVRAFSHGCVRLADPAGFAHALLTLQNADPAGVYDRALSGGKETVLTLKPPMPVHLVYFMAFPDEDGRMNWRPDIYGRDAAIWAALEAGGVELLPLDG